MLPCFLQEFTNSNYSSRLQLNKNFISDNTPAYFVFIQAIFAIIIVDV